MGHCLVCDSTLYVSVMLFILEVADYIYNFNAYLKKFDTSPKVSLSLASCFCHGLVSLVGAAFSKHIVHLYSYTGVGELRQHLEIDAHIGGVNDIAFSHPNNKQLCVITCGDDKTIKV